MAATARAGKTRSGAVSFFMKMDEAGGTKQAFRKGGEEEKGGAVFRQKTGARDGPGASCDSAIHGQPGLTAEEHRARCLGSDGSAVIIAGYVHQIDVDARGAEIGRKVVRQFS